MVIAFIFAIVMNVGSYWFSDKIVLKLYRATPLDQSHDVYSIVREIAMRARVPMPKIYQFPSQAPNAFATGRNPDHGVIAVSDGLLHILNREELAGVLAHEMSHVINRDTLISAVSATLASAIIMIANMAKWGAIFGGFRRDNRGGGIFEIIAMAIVAPFAAMMIQMAISRSREFQADKSAAKLLNNGEGLISALKKISTASKQIPLQRATQATSHMFIINPLAGGSISKLFSTHPPLEERIKQIRSQRYYG